MALIKSNAIFLEFAVTSVIKIYTKMWELWVYPNFNHLYIQLNFK